jgi:hypothetical protein
MHDVQSIEIRARRSACFEQRSIDEAMEIAGRQLCARQLRAQFGADARRLTRGDDDPWAFSS